MDKELNYTFDDKDYTHYIDYGEWQDFITNEFASTYGLNHETANNIIEDMDLWDTLEEWYLDALHEHFKDEAYQQFLDDEEYRKDPCGYYGVSESDFH